MGILQLVLYIGIFIWMMSPDPVAYLVKSSGGRRILWKAGLVVCVGHLLSMTSQMVFMIVLDALPLPTPVIDFFSCGILVFFWLMEAEVFHRLQYKISLAKKLRLTENIKKWVLVTLAMTVIYAIYTAVGGMAVTYALAENNSGLIYWLLKLSSILFQLRLPDLFLMAGYTLLYYKTMRRIIYAAEWSYIKPEE